MPVIKLLCSTLGKTLGFFTVLVVFIAATLNYFEDSETVKYTR